MIKIYKEFVGLWKVGTYFVKCITKFKIILYTITYICFAGSSGLKSIPTLCKIIVFLKSENKSSV